MATATEQAGAVLGRVSLITGKEEFLNQRSVERLRAAVRRHDPQSEVSETSARDLSRATLGELTAPSLFSTVRCVVVRNLEDLPDESVDGLLAYAAAPVDDVALVLVHGGGQKGSGVLTKLRKLKLVDDLRSGELKSWEYAGFVVAEARSHGGRVDKEAAQALVQAVGQDLRALAGAADQLVADAAGRPVTEELVRRYFGGRAEAKSFVIADAAFAGRRQVALEELRWALTTGTPTTFVTSAFAGSARSLARYQAASGTVPDNDLAREVGVPPWKLKDLKTQLQGWTEHALADAIRAVAQADADIKGAASDPSYTLERLVLTVTTLRETA